MLLRPGFRQWRRGRPFWGASLLVLAGVELFAFGRSGVSVGGVVLQLGFSGMQTTVIPIVVVLAGVLAMLQPVHHLFYGVIGLVLSVYSLVAVNAGGLGVGAVLGIVGSIVVVSFLARPDDAAAVDTAADDAAADDLGADDVGAGAAVEDGLAEGSGLSVFGLTDQLPSRRAARRSAAAVLSVALAAGGLAGAVPAGGPCILGFILCDVDLPPLPGQSPSPSPSPSPTSSPSPSASAPAESPSPSAPATDDGDDGDDVGEDPATAGEGDDAAPAEQTPESDPAQETPDAAPGVTVEVPEELPAPDEDALPIALGGTEDADVFAIPAELKASDLEIAGIEAIALVSVPVGDSGERRAALKIVADHVVVSGFRLRTYLSDRSGGTVTTSDAVTMDGHATMYITSLTASGPDGESLAFDAAHPPTTLTALLLAALNPTVGLLGATSDRQTWAGFDEAVWEN